MRGRGIITRQMSVEVLRGDVEQATLYRPGPWEAGKISVGPSTQLGTRAEVKSGEEGRECKRWTGLCIIYLFLTTHEGIFPQLFLLW